MFGGGGEGGEWLLVVRWEEEGSNVEEVHDTSVEAQRFLLLGIETEWFGRVEKEGLNRDDIIFLIILLFLRSETEALK